MSDYSPRIRAARTYAGLSQKELADALGVDEQTIKRRESGRQEPKLAERIALASVCKIPPEFMEHGWGALDADEIRVLLNEQSAILQELRALLSGESGALLPAIREILDGRPPGAPPDQPGESLPPDDAPP